MSDTMTAEEAFLASHIDTEPYAPHAPHPPAHHEAIEWCHDADGRLSTAAIHRAMAWCWCASERCDWGSYVTGRWMSLHDTLWGHKVGYSHALHIARMALWGLDGRHGE